MLSLLLGAALFLQASQPAQTSATDKATKLDDALQPQISAWINGNEHQEIPWKVRIQKPILTFQQRTVVRVTADIESNLLQANSIRRDLIFIIKVADDSGHWFEDENFVTEEITQPLDRSTKVEMESEVLLQPGKYRIATIVYDGVLKQHNVSFNAIEVGDIKNDPLPHLLDGSERAEFVRGKSIEGANAFSEGHAKLPISTNRPVQIDLLADLSMNEPEVRDMGTGSGFGFPRREAPKRVLTRSRRLDEKSYLDRLLQSANVLSELEPSNGCVRVTVFDALKQSVALEPTIPKSIHWGALRDKVLGPERDTISLAALKGRPDAPKFIIQQFDRASSGSVCGQSTGQKALHVVILLSRGVQFPPESQRLRFEACDCIVFYLRQSDAIMSGDNLKGMLSPLSPKVMDFHDPTQLRKRIAELVEQIQNAAQ